MKMKEAVSLDYENVKAVIESNIRENNSLIQLILSSGEVGETINQKTFDLYQDVHESCNKLLKELNTKEDGKG